MSSIEGCLSVSFLGKKKIRANYWGRKHHSGELEGLFTKSCGQKSISCIKKL